MFTFYSAEYSAPAPPPIPVPWTPALLSPWSWHTTAVTGSIGLSGSSVTQWTDQSGNGRTFTRDSRCRSPVLDTLIPGNSGAYGINFKGGGALIRYDARLLETISVVAVLYHGMTTANSPTGGRLFGHDPDAVVGATDPQVHHPISILFDTSPPYTAPFIGSLSGTLGDPSPTTGINPRATSPLGINTLALFGSVHDGETLTNYLNGYASTTPTLTQALSVHVDGLKIGPGFSIASSTTSSTPLTICEMVVLLSPLSDSKRQKCEGYLAHKWNLEGMLDAGHPYKASPPMV